MIGMKFAYRQAAKTTQEFINCKAYINKNFKRNFFYSHTPFSLDDTARRMKEKKPDEYCTTISAPDKIKVNFFIFAISI